MTGLTCTPNVKLRMEIGECLLNFVAGHWDHREPRAVAPSLRCRSRIRGFEDLKGVPWREMSTFEADGAVERRGRHSIGGLTGERGDSTKSGKGSMKFGYRLSF
jgi:hypothetical protein